MPAYTLTIAIDPPLKLYIAAHNDAGAMAMAREHVDREFTAERDEAVLTAMVVGERQGWSAVLEHDREDGRAT